MALIRCKECGKEISDKAEICPSCGYKINNKEKIVQSNQIRAGSIVSLIACSIVIILVIVYIIMVNGELNTSNKTTINFGVLSESIDNFPEICCLINLILTVINFGVITSFLCKKIYNIKTYKMFLVISAIIQFGCALLSVTSLMWCCGIIYPMFSLLNLIGAIIVATGKIK